MFFVRQPQISEYFYSSGWCVSPLFLEGLSYMTFMGLPVWMKDLFSVAWGPSESMEEVTHTFLMSLHLLCQDLQNLTSQTVPFRTLGGYLSCLPNVPSQQRSLNSHILNFPYCTPPRPSKGTGTALEEGLRGPTHDSPSCFLKCNSGYFFLKCVTLPLPH